MMAIAAGQALIADGGLRNCGVRKIAKKIGYAAGTLYNVFSSHDELILYVNGKTLDDLHDFLYASLPADLAGGSALRCLAAGYLDFALRHRARWQALFEHARADDFLLPLWYQNKMQRLFLLAERPLQLLLGDGQKASYATKNIWAGMHGVCALGLSGRLAPADKQALQQRMYDLLDHYLAGLLQSQRRCDIS